MAYLAALVNPANGQIRCGDPDLPEKYSAASGIAHNRRSPPPRLEKGARDHKGNRVAQRVSHCDGVGYSSFFPLQIVHRVPSYSNEVLDLALPEEIFDVMLHSRSYHF